MNNKLKGSLTINIGREVTRIEIRDDLSRACFFRAEITPAQLSDLMSGLSEVKIDMDIMGTELIGKQVISEDFEFPFKESTWGKRVEEAQITVKKLCPDGWKPDMSFGSQGSFFTKDGEHYARTRIRKWVEV